MSAADAAAKRNVRPFSVRRHVDRKILAFSILIGVVAAVSVASAYIASAYSSLRQKKEVNQHALSEITCTVESCDTSIFTTDSQWSEPDYVLDTKTGSFIAVPAPTGDSPGRFAPLDYADTAFIGRFRQPVSYKTLDGEVWRLYSRPANVAGEPLEIIVGYAEKAPWRIAESSQTQVGIVDAALKRDADKIAANPLGQKAVRDSRLLAVDGFEVVDANTRQVVFWGPWLPTFLPQDGRPPTSGSRFYIYDDDLYLIQTDTDGRLLATSLVHVGGLWWLAAYCAIGFLTTTAIARSLSRRFLRSYFATTGIRVPTLDEALRSGEGQNVEFKRGLSDDENRTGNVEDELLKSIAAFANTNDGVIFIGIDDAGHPNGLELDFKRKDRFERKIRQLVRTHIKPPPHIQVTFEDVRGLVIAKITVARGEAPAYMMRGVIYVRDGSSDVQAQPEDLRRLVSQYAF